VLFIVVDTMRADRMSLYGYARPTTPHLEALAEDAVVFANARTQAGCTYPSVNALLTSRSPATFLRPGAIMGIPRTVPSLPEILHERGYATAAVSASPIVRNTPSRVNPTGGFGGGVDTFDESCHTKHADCVNAKALELLPGLRAPWYLYLHYMEPHAPYRPPAGHKRRFAASNEEARARGVSGWARRGEGWPVARRLYDGNPQYQLTPQNLAHLADLYDEEVSSFDEQLAALFEALRARGVLDQTLVVLAADHGEELYDHGHFGHCRNLAYETLLRTPLVLWLPDAPAGQRGVRRQALVENLDVVPTVLDYLGVPAADRGFEGMSLRPVIESDRPLRQASLSMQGVTRTLFDGRNKLTLDLDSGRSQLFDLRTDPGERTDLAARRPAEARRLQAALLRWIESREGPVASGEAQRRAHEVEKKLRALGYL
jgi:arylsulfatase A-like enzyme